MPRGASLAGEQCVRSTQESGEGKAPCEPPRSSARLHTHRCLGSESSGRLVGPYTGVLNGEDVLRIGCSQRAA